VSKMKTQIGARLKDTEISANSRILELLENSGMPDGDMLQNLIMFTNRIYLADYLFINHLYEQLLPVHGVIAEFGVKWGKNLALLTMLRGIYEPFNYTRMILGFDTFEGFAEIHVKDGKDIGAVKGNLSTGLPYVQRLEELLNLHESISPVNQIKKHELIVGDASVTFPEYLKAHPEAIFALVYLDMDLYQPTRDVLANLEGHVTKGSIIAFDEAVSPRWPGETIALKESWLCGQRLRRVPWNPAPSYIVVE